MHEPQNYEQLRVTTQGQNLSDFLLPSLLENMKLESAQNQKILDFGCGTGSLAFKCLLPIAEETNSTILGLDISEEMIQHAKENHTHKKLSFKRGDILDNGFELGESDFDSIIAFHVLHFIKDYRGVLQKFYDLLKPGGQCGITVSGRYPISALLAEDPEWAPYVKKYRVNDPDWTYYGRNFSPFAKSSIEKAAQEIGFKILDAKLQEVKYPFASFNSYAEFRLTLATFINTIPTELRKRLHSSLKTHLCKFNGYTDTAEFHKKEYLDCYQAVVIVLERPADE